MTNKNDTKKHFIEFALSLTLIAVTVVYTLGTLRMADLMQETNRAELRPYLYIKFLDQIYFKYNNINAGTLLYTLTNNGKISATEIIRSYKVYKITGDKAIISRPTYINIDFVYALAPQETLEGQPDQIDGINFSEKDISDGSYYLIELYVSYTGTESREGIIYYSKVEVKVQPLSLNNGSWKYALYLMHRDEGVDQNLWKFSNWRDSNSPEILGRTESLRQIYKENGSKKMPLTVQPGPNIMGAELFGNSFYYFNSTFAQSIAALFALFGIFLIFRFEWENQKLFRTYDNAKQAVIKRDGAPHLACLDKDVKFYLLQHSCDQPDARGSRDIRIQIHNLEEVLHSMFTSIKAPAILFAMLFTISISSFAWSDFQNNKNWLSSIYYGVLIVVLIGAMIWLYKRAHKLSRNANEFTFNTLNPYKDFEKDCGLATSTFLHLIENIDLIEREVIEFTDFPFIMNFSFADVENAIGRRKKRKNTLKDLEQKKHITSDTSFLIQAMNNQLPDDKEKEINNEINAENNDRLRIMEYLSSKHSVKKEMVSNLLFKIHAKIEENQNNAKARQNGSR